MEHADFIVIGSGIAGLRAAIELGPHGRVVLLTKSRTDESNTGYAQGGIAAAMSDEDEIGLHYEDTIRAGDGLCDETAVRALVEEGPTCIRELIDWGAQFDREGVRLAFAREGAHSRRRVLHAQGDSTGREISRTLTQKLQSFPGVRVLPYSFALRLLVGPGGCEGVSYLEEKTGQIRELCAPAVLLATGGLGRVYRDTTNPDIATGDGYALAFQAGAALVDMEFVQFHPTALHLEGAPSFLLSETLRGEGAILRNSRGEVFMKKYHPLAELASRDVVSRSIFMEARQNGPVFLDLSHLDPAHMQRRFPRIYQTCLRFGLDITRQQIPVFPAAHYMMGGVYTDLCCRTTIPGLFAAGEVACNGVHGANRLASNSLLEGLVYGARAGRAMAGEVPAVRAARTAGRARGAWMNSGRPLETHVGRNVVQEVMSEKVGIVRSGPSLLQALSCLNEIPFCGLPTKEGQEVDNMLVNARLIAGSALQRTESRGGHYRADYPQRDDRKWKRRFLVRYLESRGEIVYETLEENISCLS